MKGFFQDDLRLIFSQASHLVHQKYIRSKGPSLDE
jgi:hypothetical protein